MPAAHAMPARMSESKPPHLPSTRTGRIQPLQVMPAMPVWLLVMAPRIPATRVPCQLLLDTLQPANSGFLVSPLEIQSPGSDASEARPAPSLAARERTRARGPSIG